MRSSPSLMPRSRQRCAAGEPCDLGGHRTKAACCATSRTAGEPWRPKGSPRTAVPVHDFADQGAAAVAVRRSSIWPLMPGWVGGARIMTRQPTAEPTMPPLVRQEGSPRSRYRWVANRHILHHHGRLAVALANGVRGAARGGARRHPVASRLMRRGLAHHGPLSAALAPRSAERRIDAPAVRRTFAYQPELARQLAAGRATVLIVDLIGAITDRGSA